MTDPKMQLLQEAEKCLKEVWIWTNHLKWNWALTFNFSVWDIRKTKRHAHWKGPNWIYFINLKKAEWQLTQRAVEKRTRGSKFNYFHSQERFGNSSSEKQKWHRDHQKSANENWKCCFQVLCLQSEHKEVPRWTLRKRERNEQREVQYQAFLSLKHCSICFRILWINLFNCMFRRMMAEEMDNMRQQVTTIIDHTSSAQGNPLPSEIQEMSSWPMCHLKRVDWFAIAQEKRITIKSCSACVYFFGM